MKSLSVVILTYNSNKTLKKCLHSLEIQTDKDFEVLIVDDNSTDNTLEIVKSFFDKSRIYFRILKNGAHSISRGRNIGIRACKTRYITFLDSDAYAHKDWVKSILSDFKKDSKLSVVGGDTLPIFTSKLSYANALVYEVIRNLTRKGLWKIEGGNSAFDTKKLKGEFFNEDFKHCEDVEFFSRIKDNHKIIHDSSIKIDHEHRDSLKKYFIQQYKYGTWELFFNFSKKQEIRLPAFIPSLLILGSIIMSGFNPLFILTIPLLSLLLSLFVWGYKKSQIKFFPYLFISFFFKIIGWGAGVIVGLIEVLFKSKRYRKLLKS
jgi:glycosyltransferase involved in cell wall biosynthesis